MSRSTWMSRLEHDRAAKAELFSGLVASGLRRGDSDTRTVQSAFGAVQLDGERFAAAAQKIADGPSMRSFFESWGYGEAGDRLIMANALLMELGYSDE